MRKLYDKYFICEEGHITVGDYKKTKCDAEGYQINYVKGKRKGQWIKETKKEKPCGKPIIKEGIIPDKMEYIGVWDYEVMHAFLIGQKFDAEFMVGLQEQFTRLYDRITELEKK